MAASSAVLPEPHPRKGFQHRVLWTRLALMTNEPSWGCERLFLLWVAGWGSWSRAADLSSMAINWASPLRFSRYNETQWTFVQVTQPMRGHAGPPVRRAPARPTSHVGHQHPPRRFSNGLHGITVGRDVGELPGGARRGEAEEERQLPDGLARVDGGVGHVFRLDLQAKPNQDPREQQGQQELQDCHQDLPFLETQKRQVSGHPGTPTTPHPRLPDPPARCSSSKAGASAAQAPPSSWGKRPGHDRSRRAWRVGAAGGWRVLAATAPCASPHLAHLHSNSAPDEPPALRCATEAPLLKGPLRWINALLIPLWLL